MATEILLNVQKFALDLVALGLVGIAMHKLRERGMARRRRNHWPQDLVNMILLRLPVKSIIRFKCVSKTWKSLFETSGFVSQQLSISKEVHSRRLICYSDDKADEVLIRLFRDQTSMASSYQDMFLQIPQHVDARKLRLCVHDGLLCLCDTNNSRVSLWNPATRKFRLLPDCDENFPPNAKTYVHCIGFGSDPLLNDYKVIYIRRYLDLGSKNILGMPLPYLNGPLDLQLHIAVYRMSANSWRLLTGEDHTVDIFAGLRILSKYSDTCVNGVYYWLATKFEFYKVLAFDFSNEVFRLIDWPPVPEPKMNVDLLRVPDNRISLWLPDYGMTNISHDIWVLNEDGQCWTKLLRIGPHSGVLRMFGLRNKNLNKVYVGSVGGELLAYDLDTQEFRDVGIRNKKCWEWDVLEVYTFGESLISVGRDQIESGN